MLSEEAEAVYYENHTEHTYILCTFGVLECERFRGTQGFTVERGCNNLE
jgi:hypothetical protein